MCPLRPPWLKGLWARGLPLCAEVTTFGPFPCTSQQVDTYFRYSQGERRRITAKTSRSAIRLSLLGVFPEPSGSAESGESRHHASLSRESCLTKRNRSDNTSLRLETHRELRRLRSGPRSHLGLSEPNIGPVSVQTTLPSPTLTKLIEINFYPRCFRTSRSTACRTASSAIRCMLFPALSEAHCSLA